MTRKPCIRVRLQCGKVTRWGPAPPPLPASAPLDIAPGRHRAGRRLTRMRTRCPTRRHRMHRPRPHPHGCAQRTRTATNRPPPHAPSPCPCPRAGTPGPVGGTPVGGFAYPFPYVWGFKFFGVALEGGGCGLGWLFTAVCGYVSRLSTGWCFLVVELGLGFRVVSGWCFSRLHCRSVGLRFAFHARASLFVCGQSGPLPPQVD